MLKSITLRAVKTSAVAADHLRPPRPGVIVLIYHRVGGSSGLESDLPLELFRSQMEALAQSGRATSLDDALEALALPNQPLEDPLVVTFDDGTADFVEAALPILEQYAIPATVYVATDFVERGTWFPNDGRPLTWNALGDALSTSLVTVGSHTHTHALLDRLALRPAEDELDRSIGLIEERLGVAPKHFAYPKALLAAPDIEAAVRSRFCSAALGGNRPNPYGATDSFRLARSGIQVADGMRWFRRKIDGGMALEETLRRALNRRRYADLTN